MHFLNILLHSALRDVFIRQQTKVLSATNYSRCECSSGILHPLNVWMNLFEITTCLSSSLSSSLLNIIAIVGTQTKGLYQRLLMSPPQPLSHGHQLLPLYSHSFIPLYVEIGWPTINFRVNSGRIYYPLSASIALMEIYFTSLLCPI